MPVLPIKTEPKCKLCKSADRAEIDALLEKRSRREQDPGGNQINEAYVLERLAEWGIPNPTAENLKNHWKKHCQVISEGDALRGEEADAKRDAAAIAVFERVLGPEWETVTPTPEQILELQRALFPFQIRRDLEAGRPLGITWDQVRSGIDSSTRRRQEENTGKLIGALAGGIAQALGSKPEQPAIEGAVVEDAEVVASIAEERADG